MRFNPCQEAESGSTVVTGGHGNVMGPLRRLNLRPPPPPCTLLSRYSIETG